MDTKALKKLLTIEDLVQFCETKQLTSFSSKESGYKLAVQVPAQFEINKEQNDNSLLFCLVKLMHSGENRNHSSVTDDALEKASKTLAYKPILANFVSYTDPETNEALVDFTSHDMEITPDGIIYQEHQIGCFTADAPYFEVEEDTGRNFLYGYCAIPRDYTNACSVIERKNGTKVSVELEINEMQYSAKNKVLELTDINILGATCLGKDPDTLENVEEGMKNARLDIIDFSKENNSMFTNYSNSVNEKLIETLEKINRTLANFNIKDSTESNNTYGKEDIEKVDEKDIVLNEETEVVEETVEEVVQETIDDVSEESTGEDETEADESKVPAEDETPEVVEEFEEVTEETVEESFEESDNTTEEVKPEKYSITMSNGMVKEFALSLDEINYALYSLVNDTYSESDNAWYSVFVYEDGTLVMYDWWNGKAFRQSYKREEDNFSLIGDRVPVKQIWVTDEEEASLNEMKSNYSALEQFKINTENAQLHAEREAIIFNKKYSVLAEKNEENIYKNKAYGKLVSEMDNYSLTDLEKEVKAVFADHITNGGHFACNGEEETKQTSKKTFAVPTSKKSSRYGNLFNK